MARFCMNRWDAGGTADADVPSNSLGSVIHAGTKPAEVQMQV